MLWGLILADEANNPGVWLASLPPTPEQRRLSLVVAAVLLAAFAISVPFAATPLRRVDAFIPALDATIFVTNLITSLLLFAQFSIYRSRALLALASGYLFTALIVVPHALTFPGVFSETGLLGAGLQSTVWLYFFWHLGFPASLTVYVLLKNRSTDVTQGSLLSAIGLTVVSVVVVVSVVTWLATAGDKFLPRLLLDRTEIAPLLNRVFILNILVAVLALILLGTARQRSVLDQWLMIVALAFIAEQVFGGLLSGTRFSVGFYIGRVFSLVTSTVVLVMFLAETTRLYARLEVRTHELTNSLEELRIAQGHLIQTEKLAALGRLVAGVAHEINTPVGNSLTVASTFMDKADRFEADVASDNVRRSTLMEYLAASREAASQIMINLNHAVDLIQSFKQVAADRNFSDRRGFDLGQLTEQIVKGLRSGLRSHNLLVTVDCEPNLAMTSYPGPYGQVLTNLVLNSAAHAFPDEGRGSVHITARALGKDNVEIILSDDGCGMSPEIRRHAFDPFFTTRRDHGSTGLGLHIVHNIVTNRLGGSIQLDTKPDEGTKVRIIVPRKAPLEITAE